jgi:hypothetical protein
MKAVLLLFLSVAALADSQLPSAAFNTRPRPSPSTMDLAPAETMMDLALRLYGSIDYWKAIQAVNPKQAVDEPIEPGAKLKLFPSKPIAPKDVPDECFNDTYLYCSQSAPGKLLEQCLKGQPTKITDRCRLFLKLH